MVASAAAALTVLAASTAPAATTAVLDQEDMAALERIEDYLDGMRSMSARFVQQNPDGTAFEGTMYISRPGRLRLEYDEAPYRIVANDGWLIYADDELGEATTLKLDETPAIFLLRDDIRLFGGDVAVAEFARDDGVYRVRLVRRDNPGAGSATLVFTEGPLTLRQWRIVDARGEVTDTTLIDPQRNVPIADSKFEYQDRSFQQGN